MIIEFLITDVPKNWLNLQRNRFILHAGKKEWLDSTIFLGRRARLKEEVPLAEKGHEKRIVDITLYRRRFLDRDGAYASVKPIVDGLKTILKRKEDKHFVSYEGAGLIFDDDESHIDLKVHQEKPKSYEYTLVRIEINE